MLLPVNYDVTSPPLFIFGIPEITNEPYVNLVIQTEPGSSVYQDGYPVSGFLRFTTLLQVKLTIGHFGWLQIFFTNYRVYQG